MIDITTITFNVKKFTNIKVELNFILVIRIKKKLFCEQNKTIKTFVAQITLKRPLNFDIIRSVFISNCSDYELITKSSDILKTQIVFRRT